VQQEIVPLMLEMIDDLARFIELDHAVPARGAAYARANCFAT
jgi:hypothetical protein